MLVAWPGKKGISLEAGEWEVLNGEAATIQRLVEAQASSAPAAGLHWGVLSCVLGILSCACARVRHACTIAWPGMVFPAQRPFTFPCITETNRIHLALIGMQIRTFGPCFAAIDRILISE
jgi:hypothetical protein